MSKFASATRIFEAIHCGFNDITDKASQKSFTDGVSYEQAKRQVFDHLFQPKNACSEYNNVLAYLDVSFADNLGISLSDRELDLFLCTVLTRSTLERDLDFERAGLDSLLSEHNYLFHGRLQLYEGYSIHLWYLINRHTAKTELVALDD